MTGARVPLGGTVDFSTMYVAHDAFSRDLRRLASACEGGRAFGTRTRAGWAMFTKQLHIHHTAEDLSLWPRLRAQPLGPDEVQVLDAMETEHAQIDPQLERVDAAFADCDAEAITAGIHALTDGLTAHMRHEEDNALPLVEARLGRAGWDAFGRDVRKTQGLRGGVKYLPWALDGATDSMTDHVLGLLPAPARFVYRRVLAPRYRRGAWWDGTAPR